MLFSILLYIIFDITLPRLEKMNRAYNCLLLTPLSYKLFHLFWQRLSNESKDFLIVSAQQ